MRRLRASAAAAARPRTPTAHARNNIRAAASLLAWLRGRGTELAACGQADIDQWLRTGPSACLARDFLAWAASRGHCQRVSIPAPPRPTGPAISQDQRWTLTARLLHDTALDPTDRVAGCLLLLYGQPLSRIAAMTTSQVTRRDDQTFIRLGRHDVPVPVPLADALRQLISGGRSYRGVGSPPATTWLFPGHLPGRPITPDTLGERLRASASTLRPDAAPRCSTSPPSCPPQSSPTSSACTRTLPPNGCTRPEATGPATQPS
jgi:integrase